MLCRFGGNVCKGFSVPVGSVFKSSGSCVVMSLLKVFPCGCSCTCLAGCSSLSGFRNMHIKALGPDTAAKWVSLWEMRSGASSFTVLLMPLEILVNRHFMRTWIQRSVLKDAACSCALVASEESQGHWTVSCVPRPSRGPAAAWLCLRLTRSLCVCHLP